MKEENEEGRRNCFMGNSIVVLKDFGCETFVNDSSLVAGYEVS